MSSRGAKAVFWVWGLALLALGPTGGCGEDESPQVIAKPYSGPHLEQTFYDQEMVESEDGQRQWILHSEQMDQYTGQEDVVMVRVTMDFYRDGAVFSTLTADSGRANIHTRNVKAWGDVVVETTEGRKLETQELFFDNETEEITNDVFDRFTWEDGVATGIGIIASPDLDYFEIKREFSSDIADQPAGEEEGI